MGLKEMDNISPFIHVIFKELKVEFRYLTLLNLNWAPEAIQNAQNPSTIKQGVNGIIILENKKIPRRLLSRAWVETL